MLWRRRYKYLFLKKEKIPNSIQGQRVPEWRSFEREKNAEFHKKLKDKY
jgi:hypothetical protein